MSSDIDTDESNDIAVRAVAKPKTPDCPEVSRRLTPTGPSDTDTWLGELIETIRDVTGRVSRLRLQPYGYWYLRRDDALVKEYRGYGYVLRLESNGPAGTWDVVITMDQPMTPSIPIAEQCSRDEAFRKAALAARRISGANS